MTAALVGLLPWRRLILPGLALALVCAVALWGRHQSTRADAAEARATSLSQALDLERRSREMEEAAHARDLAEIERLSEARQTRAEGLARALAAVAADHGTARDGAVAPVLRDALDGLRLRSAGGGDSPGVAPPPGLPPDLPR
jgi:hypothetical protein